MRIQTRQTSDEKLRDDGVKVMILLTFQVLNIDLMVFSWIFFVFFVRHCVAPGKPETLSFIYDVSANFLNKHNWR